MLFFLILFDDDDTGVGRADGGNDELAAVCQRVARNSHK